MEQGDVEHGLTSVGSFVGWEQGRLGSCQRHDVGVKEDLSLRQLVTAF